MILKPHPRLTCRAVLALFAGRITIAMLFCYFRAPLLIFPLSLHLLITTSSMTTRLISNDNSVPLLNLSALLNINAEVFMQTDLLADFESAIASIADVYFFAGFLSGFVVCALVVAFAAFLSR